MKTSKLYLFQLLVFIFNKINLTQDATNLGKSQFNQPQFCPEHLKQKDRATSRITLDENQIKANKKAITFDDGFLMIKGL